MEHFARLEFPYSIEIRHFRHKECIPNLEIENQHQSYYALLKYIRNELIHKKLREKKQLVFDRYVTELLGLQVDMDEFYPPQDWDKLAQFLDRLVELGINEMDYYSVIYYILKDFGSTRAESFAQYTDVNRLVTSRISRQHYNFINAIYYIDRFNITDFLKFISVDINLEAHQPFVNHLIKLANIIPSYIPSLTEDRLHSNDLNQVKYFIDLKTNKTTSWSVVSTVETLQSSVLTLDLDVLLLYLDALVDVSSVGAIALIESLMGNYRSSKISNKLLFKIVVKKLLVKSLRQLEVVRELLLLKVISEVSFNKIVNSLPVFQLLNTKMFDEIVDSVLQEISDKFVSKEEQQLSAKFPNYFLQLNQFNHKLELVSQLLLSSKLQLKVSVDYSQLSVMFNKQFAFK